MSFYGVEIAFFEKWGTIKLHVECHVARTWNDIEGVEYGGHTKATVYSADDVWNVLEDSFSDSDDFVLPAFSNRAELVAFLNETLNESGEGECGYTVWKSRKAYTAHIDEKTRQRLEATAASLAASLKVPQGPGSLQFIRAARKYLRQSNARQESYREGLREDGLCASGGSVDEWFEMSNDSRGDQYNVAKQVGEALAWVKSKCPLLWAQYRESVLARRAKASK